MFTNNITNNRTMPFKQNLQLLKAAFNGHFKNADGISVLDHNIINATFSLQEIQLSFMEQFCTIFDVKNERQVTDLLNTIQAQLHSKFPDAPAFYTIIAILREIKNKLSTDRLGNLVLERAVSISIHPSYNPQTNLFQNGALSSNLSNKTPSPQSPDEQSITNDNEDAEFRSILESYRRDIYNNN